MLLKKQTKFEPLDQSMNKYDQPSDRKLNRSKHGFQKIADKLTISAINYDILPIFLPVFC